MYTLADKFFGIVYDIYGTYLDSLVGYQYWREKIIEIQNGSNLSIGEMDKRQLMRGRGNPNEQNSYPQHISTQGVIKEKNKNGGKNYKIISNLCLVYIFSCWEYYRKEIAKEKGINYKEIKSDLMADIRYIRNSILKHDGKGNDEMEKCKTLKWFKKDDEIFITGDKMEEIVSLIKEFTKELNKEYYT